jgi:hypothetical protein
LDVIVSSTENLRIWLRPWVDRRWSTDPWCIAHDSLHDHGPGPRLPQLSTYL